MMTAILIDDERHALDNLEYEINQHCPEIEILCKCSSGKEGLLAIKKYDPNIVFLDIEMPYMNGFEMIDILDKTDFEVIFVSAYDKHAFRAQEMEVFDFISKPVNGEYIAERIDNLSTKILARKESKSTLSPREYARKQKILLPTQKAYYFLDAEDILYLKADGSYTQVYQMNSKMTLVSKTLKEMENKLPDSLFFRCHNSFIINLNAIDSFVKSEGGKIIMKNKDEIKVSRNKKEELLNLF